MLGCLPYDVCLKPAVGTFDKAQTFLINIYIVRILARILKRETIYFTCYFIGGLCDRWCRSSDANKGDRFCQRETSK
ncbi:MAG: hypothetical protein QNJ72_36945 [Pleurocapsa sp. MO_226.B13]|nr:hypothetical protein [Pleurocapsa sp. MO_226.B13]